jgi:hypothetical protein
MPMMVSVQTLTNTEHIWAKFTIGHNRFGKIHRFNIKPVYVKGIDNNDMKISETDKFIKYFHNSVEMRSPFTKTIIVIKLLVNDMNAVVE